MKYRIDLNCNVSLFNPALLVPPIPAPLAAVAAAAAAAAATTVVAIADGNSNRNSSNNSDRNSSSNSSSSNSRSSSNSQTAKSISSISQRPGSHQTLCLITLNTSELLEFSETEFKDPHNVPEQKGREEKGRESSRERARQGRNATASSWVSLRGEKTSPADKGEYV
ncbi:hypothetical protein HZH68_005676 [Vespula germanica]|uniref:Uncharacterized protein n=1 Tax=Vespula germanica TaxID=30212 RepID=A0A834NEH9_VESGE|nr:hypothetical protein HZH68_005676 [Vespula germanica]